MAVLISRNKPSGKTATPGQANRSLVRLDPRQLRPSATSIAIYGDPSSDLDDLRMSINEQGVLVPLVVTPIFRQGQWEILSGHRRWACARQLGMPEVPCEIRDLASESDRRRAVLEYNRQRRKSFSQLMKEADLLEELLTVEARRRRLDNLRTGDVLPIDDETGPPESRNFDGREQGGDVPASDRLRNGQAGRTDVLIAQQLGIGGKDVYRQARAVWKLAQQDDIRARSGVEQLDAGTKTIHAAYKDLRRRDRFTTGFKPTPYDVWAFRHDRAFGIPHPGSIPPAIVAHAVHYYSAPGDLVVDPMAGGGSTLDVCQAMGRRCLSYDIDPRRPDLVRHDIRRGFPEETQNCDLIFCDPPYHTMLADAYPPEGVARLTLPDWLAFLEDLARAAFQTLRPGGYLALLLASQTEKDLPAGFGYIDHAFLGYSAALKAGFAPERRISCPMDGAYRPQQVRQARQEGRLLGQVRDLLIVRKPRSNESSDDGRQLPRSQTNCVFANNILSSLRSDERSLPSSTCKNETKGASQGQSYANLTAAKMAGDGRPGSARPFRAPGRPT